MFFLPGMVGRTFWKFLQGVEGGVCSVQLGDSSCIDYKVGLWLHMVKIHCLHVENC